MKPCQICNTITLLDKHHIQSRSLGGDNSKSNICLLCPNCHRNTHAGIIVIECWAMTTDGFQLLWHYKNEQPITDRLPDTYTFNS